MLSILTPAAFPPPGCHQEMVHPLPPAAQRDCSFKWLAGEKNNCNKRTFVYLCSLQVWHAVWRLQGDDEDLQVSICWLLWLMRTRKGKAVARPEGKEVQLTLHLSGNDLWPFGIIQTRVQLQTWHNFLFDGCFFLSTAKGRLNVSGNDIGAAEAISSQK